MTSELGQERRYQHEDYFAESFAKPSGVSWTPLPLPLPLHLKFLIWNQVIGEQNFKYIILNICILPSKTQHMYMNTVMKYQLHQVYMFWAVIRPMQNIYKVQLYMLCIGLMMAVLQPKHVALM